MIAAIEPALFGPADAPDHLVGSACRSCATTTFPAQGSCPRCAGTATDVVDLPTEGTLWTWTIQGFPPKPPYALPVDGFTPYPVGYVDLGGAVKVIGRLDVAPGELRIGMALRVRLAAITFVDGTEVLSYSFVAA